MLFPDLSPTIGLLEGKGYELVFSLWSNRDHEARRRAVPVIHALVAAAPRLKTWKFSAFAKPVGWMDAYLPRLDFPEGSKLVDHFVIAVERVLEAGMGEAWVLEELGLLELADVKDAPKSARPMSDLSALQKRAARPRP
jgi:hypothetical protein